MAIAAADWNPANATRSELDLNYPNHRSRRGL